MNTTSTQLNMWFQKPLGQHLLSEEVEVLQEILPHLFGYHLLQIGNVGYGCLLDSSRIMHRCLLSLSSANVINKPYTSIYASADALPFANESLDVVVLPHVLEFEDNPHELLREVERVLIPEGYIIILGFNPLSFWGAWRWLFTRRDTVPWCGQFLSQLRIKDWLALLSFKVEKSKTFFFLLPFRKKISFLKKISFTGNFGAVYVLVAKKRVATLTLLKSKWHPSPALVPEAVGTTPFKDNR
jgi:SAM-dependent methyltransferase